MNLFWCVECIKSTKVILCFSDSKIPLLLFDCIKTEGPVLRSRIKREKEDTMFVCYNRACDQTFSNKSQLKFHMKFECASKVKKKKPIKPIKQETIDLEDPQEAASPEDVEIESEKYQCPNENCLTVFTRRAALTFHIKHQCITPRFRCSACDYRSKSRRGVKQHATRKHGEVDCRVIELYSLKDPGKVTCFYKGCRKRFRSSSGLNYHLRSHVKTETK
ncbi:hypothetical protein G9C98_007947 [Cotesia typhae]|uniref:C2H2-type domain-containing protein n=1 Tax=Cotesia typhae TaxID=2053667 RepID=A0A8J5QPS1_9HYME|nr:hypothetical protein G9C98_007947 [Cotesia typhae]